MKILLVYTNRNRFMAPPPIGLAFLCPPLAEQGHEVRLLDLMFAAAPRATLEAEIERYRPDVAGFSIRNVDEQDMSKPSTTLADIRPLVQTALAHGVRTVLGGPAFSTFPEAMLRFMGADLGIAGQGEAAFPQLVRSLASKALDTTTPGLVWREEGAVRTNPPLQPGYAGVRPDWGMIEHRAYRGSMFQAAVVVKTGCAYRCSYCDVPSVMGNQFAFRDTESIVEDIRELRNEHGVRVLFLNDPAFNTPLGRAKELLEALARARLGVYLSSTFVPVTGQYDDEFFSLYRKAGGLFAVFGIEGLSETMLRSYAKPFTLDDVLRSAEMAWKHGIRPICTVMIGGPGETDTTIDEAVGTIGRLNYSMLLPGFGIRVLPRTPLFEVARAAGITAAPADLLLPKFYFSPEVDLDRAKRRVNGAVRRHGWRMLRMAPAGARAALARTFGVVL